MYNPVPLRPSEVEVDIPVRWEDQKQINEFGGLNNRRVELRAKVDSLKKQLTDLEDAEEAVLMAEDDGENPAVMVAIGESFVTEDDDAVTAFVEAETERVKAALDDADAELTRIADRMGELKKALYGRFGKAIHLENDDDDE
ncbi:hypothetical protein FNF27_03315 [Cafeteria roenbergensis]|uniref:Prefoldin subunit 4 n=1 Tax=Cafeteria roenbergensis TaxID=33653 RepID=A0A5A8CRY9_CAFRO|nr:hypothetical protein FNF31_06038 [Cafeteria roenbergensis]KAA0175307.1 hypothetical protein FNF27_03315 [Cafeteria roenbergensis]